MPSTQIFPRAIGLSSLDEAERESPSACAYLRCGSRVDGRIVVIHLIRPYGIPEGEVRREMIEQGHQVSVCWQRGRVHGREGFGRRAESRV